MQYFIFGILFTLIGLPTIENFVNFLANKFELQSYKIAKEIYQIQKTMPALQQQKEQHKNPIGFATPCIGFDVEEQEEYEQ